MFSSLKFYSQLSIGLQFVVGIEIQIMWPTISKNKNMLLSMDRSFVIFRVIDSIQYA